MRPIITMAAILLASAAMAQDAAPTPDELLQDYADCQKYRLPDLHSPFVNIINRYDTNTPCAAIDMAMKRQSAAGVEATDPVMTRLRDHAKRLH